VKLNIKEILRSSPAILTEGSVIERLSRENPQLLDPFIANSACIYDTESKEILKTIYKQYIDAGYSADLPMMIFTPTWRANPERIRQAGLFHKHLNRDCVTFLADIRKEYAAYSTRILIGGLMGCKGDAYDPKCALSAEDAFLFHQPQARELTEAGADFLIASTIPSVSEGLGMARAMTLFGDCIVSFVIRRNGTLLDGTSLVNAIRLIDSSVPVQPLGYMVNCVHPRVFNDAMVNLRGGEGILEKRLLGLQANTSQKSPEELDGSPDLLTEDPEVFGEVLNDVRCRYGLRIVGGCCGTDNRHIQRIASLTSAK
jgi:homocysteine S-methyltransferase